MKALERKRDNFVRAIGDGMDAASLKDAFLATEGELHQAIAVRDELAAALRGAPQIDEQEVLDAATALRRIVRTGTIGQVKELLGILVSRIEVDFTRRSMRDVTFNWKQNETLPHPITVDPTMSTDPRVVAFTKATPDEQRRMNAELDAEITRDVEQLAAIGRKAQTSGVNVKVVIDLAAGHLTTTLSQRAPVTFVPRYDLSNLDRISGEVLKKIGAVAVA
jgi:hypothetical protein